MTSAGIGIGSPKWKKIVRETKEAANNSWVVADNALRIAPEHDGYARQRLARFAADTGLVLKTIEKYRFTATKWPVLERRLSKISFTVHSVLATHEDRFSIVNEADSLTYDQAREIMGWSTSTRHTTGKPAATLLSLLNELIEIKRRLRGTFRQTIAMDPSESDRQRLLTDLAEVETEVEQYRDYLTGGTLSETINKILETT